MTVRDEHRAVRVSTQMSDDERAYLWQQRVFEAEAGMTNYLAHRHGGADLAEWLQYKGRIYQDLPEPHSGDHRGWQQVFFRAQALMERFLVTRHGHSELLVWARYNARVHRDVEPDHGNGAADAVGRLARQAELYSSDYRFEELTPTSAVLRISHCAIWDYREKARERGVPITLESPCEYCTGATAANIESQGYRPEYELFNEGPDKGCRWRASAEPEQEPRNGGEG